MDIDQSFADDLFANSDFAKDAVYKPLSGSALQVRVITRTVDSASRLLETGGYFEGTEIQIRCSEISAPAEGDKIAIGYTLTSPEISVAGFWQNPPVFLVRKSRPDSTRKVWLLDVQDTGL